MFRNPASVQAGFGPVGEPLLAGWECAGVGLETVRRVVLLGSVRTSMSLIDHPASEPGCRALDNSRQLLFPDADTKSKRITFLGSPDR